MESSSSSPSSGSLGKKAISNSEGEYYYYMMKGIGDECRWQPEAKSWRGGVVCMQGGNDDGSYAKNCEAPAAAINLSKPLLLTAIRSMKLKLQQFTVSSPPPAGLVMRIADLGCATGYNTLATIDMVMEALRERYNINNKDDCSDSAPSHPAHDDQPRPPEFQAFFCDLPCNDFNSLFRSLFQGHQYSPPSYYHAGVPGSFYTRLFPKAYLHVAVSLSALHWLSQIPDRVLDKRSAAWNKGRAWIDGAKKEVVEAYGKQSEEDLDNFLRCRKEEIVEGGVLFMLMGGRPASQLPQNQLDSSRAMHPFTSYMDQAWQDLVDEGLIEEETRDAFNIPAYMRSTDEVESAFQRCGGFHIQTMEYHRIVEHSKDEWIRDPLSYATAKANLVRATLTPVLHAHLGPHLSHHLFHRFHSRVSSHLSLIHKTCFYGVIVVSATRSTT